MSAFILHLNVFLNGKRNYLFMKQICVKTRFIFIDHELKRGNIFNDVALFVFKMYPNDIILKICIYKTKNIILNWKERKMETDLFKIVLDYN